MTLVQRIETNRASGDARTLWDVIFMFSVVAGVFVIVFREELLPQRFFYDGLHIQQIAQGFNSGLGDQSYVRVALVYRWLGLADHPLAASFVGYGLGVLVLLLLRLKSQSNPSWQAIALTPVAVVTMAVYLGFYGKDVFLVPIAAIALAGSRRVRIDVLLLVAMLLYALLFRTYWVLIAAAYIALRMARGRRGRWKITLLVMLLVLMAYALAIAFIVGVNPDHYRSIVNETRLTSADAASAILPFVPGESLPVGLVNVLVTLPFLVFPVPLLLIGSGYHAALFVAISLLWLLFFVGVRRQTCAQLALKGVVDLDSEARSFQRAIALVLALLTVQALFEPDYGSALRHLTPFLPIWVAILWRGPSRNMTKAEKSS